MLTIKHVELFEANDFVERYHRHHPKATGHRFSIAAYDGDKPCGVAIVGRPVARAIDQSGTVEITRLCTDGTRNACSFLYGAAARCAKELGYERIITYILEAEDGASLKASGYAFEHETRGGEWDTPSRRRICNAPTCRKKRYTKVLKPPQRKRGGFLMPERRGNHG